MNPLKKRKKARPITISYSLMVHGAESPRTITIKTTSNEGALAILKSKIDFNEIDDLIIHSYS
jgi:hypothetical protein